MLGGDYGQDYGKWESSSNFEFRLPRPNEKEADCVQETIKHKISNVYMWPTHGRLYINQSQHCD